MLVSFNLLSFILVVKHLLSVYVVSTLTKSYLDLFFSEIQWDFNLNNFCYESRDVMWLMSFDGELNCAPEEKIRLLIQSKLAKLLVFFFLTCLDKWGPDSNTRNHWVVTVCKNKVNNDNNKCDVFIRTQT